MGLFPSAGPQKLFKVQWTWKSILPKRLHIGQGQSILRQCFQVFMHNHMNFMKFMKSLSSLSIVVKSEKHRAWTIGVHHGEVPAWSLTDFTAYNGLTLDNMLPKCPLAQLAHPLFCLPKRETAHPPYTCIDLSHLSIVIRVFYPTCLCSLELRWDNPHGHVLEFLRLWSVALLDFNQNCSSFEKSLAKHQEPEGMQLQFYFWLSMISTNFTQPQNRWYVYRCVFVAQRAHTHLIFFCIWVSSSSNVPVPSASKESKTSLIATTSSTFMFTSFALRRTLNILENDTQTVVLIGNN